MTFATDKTMKTVLMLLWVFTLQRVSAEVISYTLGIDVNCPSGLSE